MPTNAQKADKEKMTRLNAAAAAVGTALGRFATELESWTHGGPRPDVARTVTNAFERAREDGRAAVSPHADRIGSLAEVAHLPSTRVGRAPSKRRAPAKPSTKPAGRVGARAARRTGQR